MTKALLILISMVIGMCVPACTRGLPAIPWMVGTLLLISACALPRGATRPTKLHLHLLVSAWGIGGIVCAALWTVDRELALGALLAGASPTAAATPTVVAAMRGSAGFAAVAVLTSNLIAAALWPFLLILLQGNAAPAHLLVLVLKVTPVVVLPWVLARLLLAVQPSLAALLVRQLPRSFLLWLACLAIMTATASTHLRQTGFHALLGPMAVAAGVCVLSFVLGRWLGRPLLALEASQCLGQKNTALAAWTALVCVGPAAALVPICYVMYHNLWNAGQLANQPFHHPSPDRIG